MYNSLSLIPHWIFIDNEQSVIHLRLEEKITL